MSGRPLALVISNPTAGLRDLPARSLERAVDAIGREGYQVEHYPGRNEREATSLAAEARERGAAVVFAAGGDGTLNAVVQALVRSEVAVGVLPSGTVNVWARELGLPWDLAAAARAQLAGKVTPVDLGLAGARYFLIAGGLGFDAAVVRLASQNRLRRFGTLIFWAAAFRLAPRFRGTIARIEFDGQVYEEQILLAVAGNTRLWGGIFWMTPHACVNDGLLDFVLFTGDKTFDMASQALALAAGTHLRHPRVRSFRGTSLKITPQRSLPLHVDAEHVGRSPADWKVAPAAIRIMVPPGPLPAFLRGNGSG